MQKWKLNFLSFHNCSSKKSRCDKSEATCPQMMASGNGRAHYFRTRSFPPCRYIFWIDNARFYEIFGKPHLSSFQQNNLGDDWTALAWSAGPRMSGTRIHTFKKQQNSIIVVRRGATGSAPGRIALQRRVPLISSRNLFFWNWIICLAILFNQIQLYSLGNGVATRLDRELPLRPTAELWVNIIMMFLNSWMFQLSKYAIDLAVAMKLPKWQASIFKRPRCSTIVRDFY